SVEPVEKRGAFCGSISRIRFGGSELVTPQDESCPFTSLLTGRSTMLFHVPQAEHRPIHFANSFPHSLQKNPVVLLLATVSPLSSPLYGGSHFRRPHHETLQ